MEVTSSTFWAILPELMGALVDSRWVAIDVEMTGISTDGHFIPPGSTPQEAYQSVKEAAELYQILQIGFTFSEYETKTIECPISPLFPPEMGSKTLTQALNRKFTTSVSSYTFLRDHNFSFTKMLDSGIPYLSREEELDVKRREVQILGDNFIDISKLSVQDMQFYSFYKSKIQRAAECERSREQLYVPIRSPTQQPLNTLEMKIIYQILQDDFPSLVVRVAPDGHFDVAWKSPSQKVARRRRHNTEGINKFIGIRHIFEALTGGEFASKIKQSWIPDDTQDCRIDPLNGNNKPGFGYAPDMSQVEAILKARSPIIVGHNIFHDLAFIYRTFFGRLPETLGEFLTIIHKLFPRIIDTKYMFLRGQSYQSPVVINRSLSELFSIYGARQFPFIRSTDNFIEKSENPHHAGHDSALTMKVFLKQAVYIKGFWSQSHYVPETLHRFRESILDEQEGWEKASQSGLARYIPLQPEQAASPTCDLLSRLEHPLQDSPPERSENYSVKEVSIIPPWSDAMWREFGNKTRIGNAGVVEFK